ncbi:hypothetical protein PM082_009606 [Marasmius tenuissimus]|nr:hypothetical protein PM082_009606 [Marasmius tenuissimus]
MLAFVKNPPSTWIGASKSGIVTIDQGTGDIQVLKNNSTLTIFSSVNVKISLTELITPPQLDQLRFMDGTVDSKNRLWIGELDIPSVFGQISTIDTSHTPQARLWRYDPEDGSAIKHEKGLYCSDGIAWSHDNRYMFHNYSYEGLVRRYDFDAEKGTLNNRIGWVDFRKEVPNPDAQDCWDGY